MTVKELREFLSNYDDDIEVGVSHDAGFCTAPLDAKDAILEKKEDWDEEDWAKHWWWIKGDKVLVFDEDALDDDEEDE